MIKEWYAHTNEDMARCFDLVQRTDYYDFSLRQSEIITAWKKMAKEGIGHLLWTETVPNQGKHRPFEGEFLSLFFTTFITRDYAIRLTTNPTIKNVGMDFLRHYHDYHFKQIGDDPCPSRADLESESCREMYISAHMMIFSPRLGIAPKLLRQTFEYSQWMRDMSKRSFSGFRLRAWFLDAIGTDMKNTFCVGGEKLLREYPENRNAPKGRERYLLCVTPDQRSSQQICIPDHIHSHAELGNWFHEVFEYREREAQLSYTEKLVGALLILNKTKEEIASVLYPDESDTARSGKMVQGHFEQIGKKLRRVGYLGENKSLTIDTLKQTLMTNIHEVRPVIYWHLL